MCGNSDVKQMVMIKMVMLICIFMTSCCFYIIYNVAPNTDDLYYGNGPILVVTALIFNF